MSARAEGFLGGQARPRVMFAGSSEFAVPSLAALLEAGYPVAGVFTQPDRPAGRGRQLKASPVKLFAQLSGLPVHQPEHLRDDEAIAPLLAAQPDFFVVASYGLLLPPRVLALPRLGCINVHASLLPRWRGAAPVARAVLAGDETSGVSIMRMAEGLDTGPVYLTRETAIRGQETAGELEHRLALLGARALLDALPEIVAGRLEPVPQEQAQATYAAKLDKAEAPLDWSRPAHELVRQVLAFNPRPVAESTLAGARVRIWRARAVPLLAPEGAADAQDREQGGPGGLPETVVASGASRNQGGEAVEPGGVQKEASTDSAASGGPKAASSWLPGTVVTARGDDLIVATGDGGLALEELQWPGKRVMVARDFLSGRSLLGERFTS